jgi:PET assembly of cytochrome c oxidase, mitochondrial
MSKYGGVAGVLTGFSLLFSIGTVIYVTQDTFSSRQKMHDGVVADMKRIKQKLRENGFE